ncbi:serine/threonine-protein phosphatase 7 long form homolog [Ananas comosus]|uniref:Serine/threonine-protein phosphatase 7 long form homolog n=1 Tax=Ananas comosus TaxID=4615 RepID=A0A6P5H251_ANACO|nr:serine/threonine-protein phosphatase 7 long form homolog [Ananas comosus]
MAQIEPVVEYGFIQRCLDLLHSQDSTAFLDLSLNVCPARSLYLGLWSRDVRRERPQTFPTSCTESMPITLQDCGRVNFRSSCRWSACTGATQHPRIEICQELLSWTNAGGLRFGANVRTTDIEFYRDELDQQRETQITWRPYTDAVLEVLPAFCVQGSEVWRSRTTLICFHIVELHVPDRVLRQFGLLQHIPIHVETIRRFTSQGRPDEHWGHFHAAHIERWEQRLQAIIDQDPIVSDDPVQATSIYMEWYWQITRRWISRPVQRLPLTYTLAARPREHWWTHYNKLKWASAG